MHRLPWRIALLLACLASSITAAVRAETPEEKGLAIALEAQRRNQGWTD